ncbi:hypothetical protein WJX73_000608 [Symbiochloris irregularis]|uniref:Dynein light chain roadblock n=1 Tax=Symbiochloris irregularis TaxID=706552 RepID=A0AAW1PY49_9CHLO
MGDIALVVDETIKRICSHKGVAGVMIVNGDGIPIKSNLDNALTVQYASLISLLVSKTRSVVKQLDKSKDDDELQSIRVQSKKHEIVVVPDFDKAHEYTLIIVQNHS